MELTKKLLSELQRRLKIGNRRGVHLNAIPLKSRYKFDLSKISFIEKNLPKNFINALLTELPLKFRISWKNNVPDLNSLFEEEQTQLVKITKAFENLINQTEAIESEKGINTFGFGFPILARRDREDNKLTVAPILIWSLRIKRTKEFNTWEINRNEDDPIYLNEVLINHLQNDSNVEIEQIPSEMLDDGLINKTELIKICVDLIKALNSTSPNDLNETFEKKLYNISPIGDKAHYEKLPLSWTNSIIEFGGLFSIFEVQKQNIINDYDNLMELEGLDINLANLQGNSFQPISSVETDPSQQSILHSLETTRNVLIQGPPGTGKSQTLTAVLINALENNKKIIVVCEKRTALEVLYEALIKKGLHYHCVLIRDIVKDRKVVVDSVRDRVDNSDYRRYRYNYSKESLNNVIAKAKDVIASINKKHQKLDEKLIGNKSWTEVVGELLVALKGNEDNSNVYFEKNLFDFTPQELNSILDVLQKGQKLYKEYLPIESVSFLNSLKLVGNTPLIIERNINDDFNFYAEVLNQIKILSKSTKNEYLDLRRTELHNQISSIYESIKDILVKESELNELIKSSKKEYQEFRTSELNQQLEDVSKFINIVEVIIKANKNNLELFDEEKTNSVAFKIFSFFSKTKRKIRTEQAELRSNFVELYDYIKSSKDITAFEFGNTLHSKKKSLETLINKVETIKTNFDDKIENEFRLFNLDSFLNNNNSNKVFHLFQSLTNDLQSSDAFKVVLDLIQATFRNYSTQINSLFRILVQKIDESKDVFLNYSFNNSFQENKIELSQIQERLELIKSSHEIKIEEEYNKLNLLSPIKVPIKSLSELQAKHKLLKERVNFNNWVKVGLNESDLLKFITTIETLIQKKTKYFQSDKDFFTIEFKWFQFYNALSSREKTVVSQIKSKRNWRKTFLIYYLNSILTNSANTDLPTDDADYSELDENLKGLESEQLKFIKQYWYSKQIDASRNFLENNNDLTVENLYLKKQGSKNKRLSLRQIVQYDPDLFTNFFPVILTSPDVASNLFKGMNGYFDIVMFDEASQLRLEDNLPAILKGKQIIIAGDEHQMPPSNYFGKMFTGEIESDEEEGEEEKETRIVIDKDDILLSCESLLEFGGELSFQKKHLDFHYRSRHPYLIDFSNYAFYNQRLKPLPNDFTYVPIKYIQVNGTFSEHTNEAEAEMVLSIIENNINRLPNGEYPTVGIATFNIAQRNLIKSKIDERKRFDKYKLFNEKIQELGLDDPKSNKGFIKNLENIQGDERDVIILSTTYGIGKDRKFAQRFGPINHSKGYKLLNVIITRAKFKVYVCSSIPEQVFMNYKDYLKTEGSNNKRAIFYAYLAYSKAVSEIDDDSRLSVLTTLAENTTKNVRLDSFMDGKLESPFEEEVYQSLADHFGTEKLIPQLQFAGFRIDIVYDPKINSVPKIAIECDGAKYHSSREAYLYDKHRQKILEDHGFVFHRIWSTNWWHNSNKEILKLIAFIKQTECITNTNYEYYSQTASAFTDDVAILEKYILQTSFIDTDKDVATIQTLEIPIAEQTKIFKDEIKLNSKVQIKYVNNGKSLNIQLVQTEVNKNSISNGIQKIYYKSPLAKSLLGHYVADIVKIGNLDTFVEVIKITNLD